MLGEVPVAVVRKETLRCIVCFFRKGMPFFTES